MAGSIRAVTPVVQRNPAPIVMSRQEKLGYFVMASLYAVASSYSIIRGRLTGDRGGEGAMLTLLTNSIDCLTCMGREILPEVIVAVSSVAIYFFLRT